MIQVRAHCSRREPEIQPHSSLLVARHGSLRRFRRHSRPAVSQSHAIELVVVENPSVMTIIVITLIVVVVVRMVICYHCKSRKCDLRSRTVVVAMHAPEMIHMVGITGIQTILNIEFCKTHDTDEEDEV